MATIRQHALCWQVQIHRRGKAPPCNSFLLNCEAENRAHEIEVLRERPASASVQPILEYDPNEEMTRQKLSDIVKRYGDNVSTTKRGCKIEHAVLTAFLRNPTCNIWAGSLTTRNFANYRNDCLRVVSTNTLCRQFATIHNMLEAARHEWGVRLPKDPIGRLKLGKPTPGRTRRLVAKEKASIPEAAGQRRNCSSDCMACPGLPDVFSQTNKRVIAGATLRPAVAIFSANG